MDLEVALYDSINISRYNREWLHASDCTNRALLLLLLHSFEWYV